MKKIILTALIWILTTPAFAQSHGWTSVDNMRARLIAGVNAVGQQDTIDAALDIELDKGWHTYWRVAGDAGLPPRFEWDSSENVESVEVLYPAPTRKTEAGGFYTFGYSDRVTFPLSVTLKEPGKAAALNLKAQTMICKDICIPQQFEITLDIPAGEGEKASLAPLIKRAKQKIPHDGDTAALKINTVVAGPDALVVQAYSKDGFENADLFPTAPNVVLTLPPEITPDKNDPRNASIRIPVTLDIKNLAESLKEQELSLTLVSGKNAIEKKIQY